MGEIEDLRAEVDHLLNDKRVISDLVTKHRKRADTAEATIARVLSAIAAREERSWIGVEHDRWNPEKPPAVAIGTTELRAIIDEDEHGSEALLLR